MGSPQAVSSKRPDRARSGLELDFRVAREQSPYKGAVIAIQRCDRRGDDFAIAFHAFPQVARKEIVLPYALMETVERNVLGFLRHREALRAAGRAMRRGVLLHGPPGTGKTLMTRYLVRSCSPCTVVLLSGRPGRIDQAIYFPLPDLECRRRLFAQFGEGL